MESIRHTPRRVIVGIAALTVAAAAASAADAPAPRGAELIAPFKLELQQALKAGLAEGPDEAVAACNTRAPAIAASRSVDGVRVGRTSHRLRNPANASPEWVEPILAAYLADASNRTPVTVEIGPGRAGYVEPIVMLPLCETCHGAAIPSELVSRIRALYPQDQATGFAAGELRGVFYVEYPVVEVATP